MAMSTISGQSYAKSQQSAGDHISERSSPKAKLMVQGTTEHLWMQFSRHLREFIERRVSEASDVDDILQDVFLKIHTRIHTLRDENRIAPWIYRIARNTIYDYYRHRRPSESLPEDLAASSDQGENGAEQQIAASLLTMLDDLPDGYRQAVILYELEGIKQEEIGVRLGLSHSGAKSRVQRGRQMLKDALLDCCHFDFDRTGRIIDYQERQLCCRQCTCA
jgi:RNA polymerase sigma-70 factor (ECF subfamily)